MPEDEIVVQIRQFLAQSTSQAAERIASLPKHTRLWDVIDSLSLLDLVEYAERQFNIVVDPVEFVPENFESIDSISTFVRRKMKTPTG